MRGKPGKSSSTPEKPHKNNCKSALTITNQYSMFFLLFDVWKKNKWDIKLKPEFCVKIDGKNSIKQ